MNVLTAENVKKYYGKEPNLIKALDGVSLKISQGEFIAVVGTSGSGKSTLLHMLGGLDNPTSGKIVVSGQDISLLSSDQLAVFRRRNVGFVFQSFNLIPILNVYENIVFPVQLDGNLPDEEFLDQILHTMGLTKRKYSLPGTLSGGQQQRVAIARALAAKPSVILADEPTGNLDSKTSQDVLGVLRMTADRFHQTIVMITHNEQVAQLADRIIRIEDGQITGNDQIKKDGSIIGDEIISGDKSITSMGGDQR